jgi:benzoyl-CoA reductase/2-hydroxyglutaryl-CoA dehydratase subunit BcrC/BadD/HgdB
MMEQNHPPQIGFVCAYTPLVLINAASFDHYRILPEGEWPDQAGHLLHDNLCPHVKRILDRALDGDLPKLAGMVFTNSCDAMRRAADAWQTLRPDEPIFIMDLPATSDAAAVAFLADELRRLAHELQHWGGDTIQPSGIENSVQTYNNLSQIFVTLREQTRQKQLNGGRPRLQELYNLAATQGLETTLKSLETVTKEPALKHPGRDDVPIYVFGNVLADPEAYALLASCGAHIVGDDFCTGSRMFSPIVMEKAEDIYLELSRCLLSQPPCARTFNAERPGSMATDILANAKACKARGVIGYTLKFCDPYLARLPHVRQVFRKEELPLLLLEGDCTLRSFGQQQTRIEAFIEMLR